MASAEASRAGRGAWPLEQLGADLAALLAGLPSQVESVVLITSLASRQSARASFRIRLRDGSSLKGRRLDSTFEAERLDRLTRHLGNPHVPAVIARHGAAVIEPWTEGRSLAGRLVDAEVLRACGALLASIHLAPAPAQSEKDIALAYDERCRRLAENIGKLCAAGAIDDGLARHIRAVAIPDRFAIGLIHGDFCAENLVQAEGGQIVAVDNETLRFEALDYDLARSWYRWTLTEAEARTFLDGYSKRRSPAGFLRDFSYWAICALVDSAVFRIAAGTEGAALPLQRLAAFVQGGAERTAWGAAGVSR